MTKDSLQHFVFENAAVRGELVHLEESYQTIMQQHAYPPVIQNVLGEALAAATLLSAIIKFKGRLSLQFQGKNKLTLLLAQCDNQFHIRGLAQWTGTISEDELPELLQEGLLFITIEQEKTGQRYQGIVTWQGNSLAESIEAYFKNSEQLSTRLWLATSPSHVAGLLLQTLPKEGEDEAWEHMTHLASTVTEHELLNLNNQTLVHRLFPEEEIRIFDPSFVKFQCRCSTERSENAILLLGKEEAEEELKEKQTLVVTCDFCNKGYIFGREDVENIFKKEEGKKLQ